MQDFAVLQIMAKLAAAILGAEASRGQGFSVGVDIMWTLRDFVNCDVRSLLSWAVYYEDLYA